MKDGKPVISFTTSEVASCEKLYEHSIVAKFTVGRPNLAEIQRTFRDNWSIVGRASLSEIWDSRHVLIIFDSEDDVRVALSSSLNKVGHAFFRLFRWFPDYNPKRESTVTTIWVRLPGLPLSLYESSFIKAIISTIGYFVDVDDRTKACKSLKFARACVELDVTKPIPEAVWINLPDSRSYWQSIEVESKLGYCTKCKVHGHSFDTCRKRKTPINMGKKDMNGKDLHNSLPKVPVEKETNPQHVCGDNNCNGDISKEDEVSTMQKTTIVDVVQGTTSLDDVSKAMVIYKGVVDADTPTASTLVPVTPESRAMVTYEEVTDTESLTMIKRDFDILKDALAAEGVFVVPQHLDDDFIMKWNRAVDKYEEKPVSPESDPENVASSISEWITTNKKKKKKGKQTRKNDNEIPPPDVRRSFRTRQATELKNSDFLYHSKGM